MGDDYTGEENRAGDPDERKKGVERFFLPGKVIGPDRADIDKHAETESQYKSYHLDHGMNSNLPLEICQRRRIRIFYLTLTVLSITIQVLTPMKRNDDNNDEEGWAYGDVWDQGSPEDREPDEDVEYVEVLRGDTGKGYSDTTMMEYILYLGAAGIHATFDAYPLREIKIYVLKVEAGREVEAMSLLREKMKNQG